MARSWCLSSHQQKTSCTYRDNMQALCCPFCGRIFLTIRARDAAAFRVHCPRRECRRHVEVRIEVEPELEPADWRTYRCRVCHEPFFDSNCPAGRGTVICYNRRCKTVNNIVFDLSPVLRNGGRAGNLR